MHSFFASLKERKVFRDILRFPKGASIRSKATWISKQEQIKVLQHSPEVEDAGVTFGLQNLHPQPDLLPPSLQT